MKAELSIPQLKFQQSGNFLLIAGPCVIEDDESPFKIAKELIRITDELRIPFIFKASYRKANRTSKDSFTGIGDQKAFNILHQIKTGLKCPVLTDVHSPEEVFTAFDWDIDVIQIPAFLCRQTDLLIAAGRTDMFINIKKGQFVSGEGMKFVVEKIESDRVMLTERGTMFGYQDLIVDYRNVPTMKLTGCPVIVDCTHSLQQPNQPNGVSGGNPQMIETIAKAAVAVGADGLFFEVHPDPKSAKSDGNCMLQLDLLERMLVRLLALKRTVNTF